MHRYSSYLMLLLGNGVCSGGIATYFTKIGFGWWGTFGVCTSALFLILVGAHEFAMRRHNNRNFDLIEGEPLAKLMQKQNLRQWTSTEIEEAVEVGDPLVICDNLVLRTNGYEKIHPGGKFVIQKNLGRDIAKFYYGNYALTSGALTKIYTHSARANRILHSMIVGVIEDQHDAIFHQTKIYSKHTLTDSIGTFTFKTLDGRKVRNYKKWYVDLSMVAKHFTVSSRALPHIRRQYTICQTMEVRRLNALHKLAKDILQSDPLEPTSPKVTLDETLFQDKETNKISLTLKNYERPNGVAT